MKRIKNFSLIICSALILVISAFAFSACSNGKYKFYGIINPEDGISIIKISDMTDSQKDETKDYNGSYIELNGDEKFSWRMKTGDDTYSDEQIRSGTYKIEGNKLKLYYTQDLKDSGVSKNLDFRNDMIILYDGTNFIIFKK